MHFERVNRLSDILQVLGAEIFVSESQSVAHLVIDRGRNANMSWARQRLKSCRDIYGIAAHSLVIDKDLAEIDANAEPDLAVFFKIVVQGSHMSLQFDAETDRVDRAVEKQEKSIA